MFRAIPSCFGWCNQASALAGCVMAAVLLTLSAVGWAQDADLSSDMSTDAAEKALFQEEQQAPGRVFHNLDGL